MYLHYNPLYVLDIITKSYNDIRHVRKRLQIITSEGRDNVAIDGGGVFRQFMSLAFESLFGQYHNGFIMASKTYPYISEMVSDANASLAIKIITAAMRLTEYQPTAEFYEGHTFKTGILFSDGFFRMLFEYRDQAKDDNIKSEEYADKMAPSLFEKIYRLQASIDELVEERKVPKKLQDFFDTECVSIEGLTIDQIIAKYEELRKPAVQRQHAFLTELLSNLRNWDKFRLSASNKESIKIFKESIQGIPPAKDAIMGCLKVDERSRDPNFLRHVNAFKAYILSREENDPWLGQFVLFITGQYTLRTNDRIWLRPKDGPDFHAATCANTIQLPIHESDSQKVVNQILTTLKYDPKVMDSQ